MKLHLPSGLRKSLLACLAALSLPALSFTLSSASSLLGGAAFVSFFAAEHASAAGITFNASHPTDGGAGLTADPDPDEQYFKGYCDFIHLESDGRILFQGESYFLTWVVDGDLSGRGNLTFDALYNMGQLVLNNGGELDGKFCFAGVFNESFTYQMTLGGDLRVKGLEFGNVVHHPKEDGPPEIPAWDEPDVLHEQFHVAFTSQDPTSHIARVIVDTDGADVNYDGNLEIGDDALGATNFEKTGQGTQMIRGKFIAVGEVAVSGGQLRLLGAESSINGSISVSGGSVLEIQMQEDSSKIISLGGAAVALDDGTLKFTGEGSATEMSRIIAGRLTVGSGGGRIQWSQDGSASNTGLELVFSTLTSAGDVTSAPANLVVADMTKTGQSIYERVRFDSITNFHGELQGNTGSNSANRFYIGRVNQNAGYSATINVSGTIYADNFRKMGDGALHIMGDLIVTGELFMDYEGVLDVQGELSVRSNSTLRYSSGSDNGLVELDLGSLMSGGDGTIIYNLDIDDVSDEILRNGISMGIIGDGDSATLEAFKRSLSLLGYDDRQSDWGVYWGGDDLHTVYLRVGDRVAEEVNDNWDSAWGSRERRNAPSSDFLDEHEYKESGRAGEFTSSCLQLSVEADFHSSAMSYVRLTEGGRHEDYAGENWTMDSVVGGRIYQSDTAGDTWIEKEYGSYISMKQAEGKSVYYHLLVGGSSCLYMDSESGNAGEAFGGFIGNSHIQVDGGKVDYIVGGNHVNNSSFSFIGDSYISVKNGEVTGAIVGGSTLTKGSANSNVHAFNGNSNIFIYTVLTGTGADAPQISDDTTSDSEEGASARRGASFGAIVGGNAWIDLPAGVGVTSMDPSFRGRSQIVIDLSSYSGAESTFEKDIVGGNYTAIVGSEEGSSNRNTTFNAGNSSTLSLIRISTPTNRSITFTGGINGASRRSSVGAGITNYTGSTLVDISGGIYTNYIAGGLWFDETANGAHGARLTGNTTVELNSGTFWRVMGGSLSMGGSGNSSENSTGNSEVRIYGGTFSVDHTPVAPEENMAPEQQQISFVAGGGFYRNNSGGSKGSLSEGNKREGNTTVTILPSASGVTFTSAHIVGGDYVNASTPAGSNTNSIVSSITGNSGVVIGDTVNNDGTAQILGLVVGGSFLTDTGAMGTISVGSTSVEIYHGVINMIPTHPDVDENVPGRDDVTGHFHQGIAVVGGNVLIDENPSDSETSGSHMAEVAGRTRIVIGAEGLTGPTIKGHVVGGSYANHTIGVNTLTSDRVEIEINSGTITGNVYGGHYTESVYSPDALTLRSVNITMRGGEVEGNIVGGGHRATSADMAQGDTASSEQGEITINLLGGKLAGNVYAAGYNSAETGSANTTTGSTRVRIGEEFEMAPASGSRSMLICGGYGRVSYLSRGTVGMATLEVLGTHESLVSALENGTLAIEEFSVADIAEDVTLNVKGDFVVLRTAEVDTANVFTKNGAGILSANGLSIWNSQDNAHDTYYGKIAVNDGSLILETEQSIASGLSFGLSTLSTHAKSDSAYLQGNGGLVLGLSGNANAAPVRLEINATVDDLKDVSFGTYYLATGLEEGASDLDFDYDIDALSEALEAHNRFLELRVMEQNLVLIVKDMAEKDLFYWDINAANAKWQNNDPDGWTDPARQNPAGHNVYFGENPVETEVEVGGVVTPRSVWVQAGEYVFSGNGSAAINIGGNSVNYDDYGSDGQPLPGQLGVGELAVGGSGRAAALTLRVPVTHVERVLLKELGTLTLDTAQAIPTTGVELVFEGGVLEYGADFSADVSGLVNAGKSTGMARVSVRDDDESIVWGGNKAATGGINVALTNGVEKFGLGSMTLEWNAPQSSLMSKRVAAYEGQLTLAMHGTNNAQLTLSADGGDIRVGDDASITLSVDDQACMLVQRAFSGSGLVVLHTAANSTAENGAFTLNADNSAFTGTIALTGQSRADGKDVAVISSGSALGGSESILRLAGMHFAFDKSYEHPSAPDGTRVADVAVRVINVLRGTSYVGGVTASPTGANGNILIVSSSLIGNGALANAWGSGQSAYRHIFEGELGNFTGTIIAGDVRTRSNVTAASSSTWTLRGQGGGDLNAALAGGGTIILDYESSRATRLVGRVGSDLTGNATISLENLSAGEMIIANEDNNSTGVIITHSKREDGKTTAGNVRLGDNSTQGVWCGSELKGDGTFILTNGRLIGGIMTKDEDARLVVQTVQERTSNPNISTKVDVGGMKATMIDDIVITAGGCLSGVSGNLNLGDTHGLAGSVVKGISAHITLGSGSVSNAPTTTAEDHVIVMDGGDVVVNDALSLRLDFTNDAFMSVITRILETENTDGSAVAWLHLVSGGKLVMDESLYTKLLAVSKDAADDQGALLAQLGFEVAGVEGGDLGLTGNTNEIYLVLRNEDEPGEMGNEPVVNGYGVLSEYKATAVATGKTLTVNLNTAPLPGVSDGGALTGLEQDARAGGAIVNNLLGQRGSVLRVNNSILLNWEQSVKDAEEAWDPELDDELVLPERPDFSESGNRVRLIFNNTTWPTGVKGPEEWAAASRLDTTFEGSIIGGEGVDFVKTGRGTLTIGSTSGEGGLTLEDGDLRLQEGGITLQGADNKLVSVTFAYTSELEEDEEGTPAATRALILRGGKTTMESIIEDGGTDLERKGAEVVLEDGATLVLTGVSHLSDSEIRQGSGAISSVVVQNEGLLALGALKSDGDSSAEPDIALAAEVTEHQLQGVNLRVENGGNVDFGLSHGSVVNLSGNGTLSGSGGSLTISGSGEGMFSGALQGEGEIKVQANGGSLTLKDAIGGAGWHMDNEGELIIDLGNNKRDLTLGNITLRSGSYTHLLVNTDRGEEMQIVQGGLLKVEEGAQLHVTSKGEEIITESAIKIGHIDSIPSRSDVEKADVTLHGHSFLHWNTTGLYMDGYDLMLGLKKAESNDFATSGMAKNAHAGAVLFWEASDTDTSEHWARIAKDKDSDLYKMVSGLVELHESGNTAALHQALAAGAGASIAVLGSALSQDIERQLRSIRNRTTTMGSESRYDGNDDLPLYHMWINGETSYHKMSADGFAPGYSLNSWGGSVGMDVDVSSSASVGLAVSAMYSDLKAKAADTASGDLTTTWLSGFARVSAGAWLHTFVVTAGLADIKLDRTVNYGAGQYTAHGRTSGYQVGALYEIGYARSLNMQGTTVLQGVANVEVRYANISGYSESRSDAGLNVDDITHTVITFGFGARLQSVVAENALNRASLFEARALVKADAGDRTGTANNSLICGSASRQEVESAELGVVGLELGAGFTVPMGRQGAFFIDASAELRSGYTEMNANMGFRLSF